MKHNLRLIVPFVMAIICQVIFQIQGSSVNEAGVLEEPFYLVVFMWIFIFIGIGQIIYMKFFHKDNKDDDDTYFNL